MRIVFFGSTKYSEELLSELLRQKHEIAAVFTLPKKFTISYSPSGVELCTYADLKRVARKFNIPAIEIKDNVVSVAEVKKFLPDLILVLGWYHMLPSGIRRIPCKGCIGIHASLLPKYSGGAPLTWALINGEKKSGVTLFYLDAGVDTGDIIAQESFAIEDSDDIASIYKKATQVSIKILVSYLPRIAAGRAPRIKQDISHRTYFPQRKPQDGTIEWIKPSRQIRNFIRAQTRPYPGAYSMLGKTKCTIWKAEIAGPRKQERSGIVGQIVSIQEKHFEVNTGDGRLRISDYDPEGLIKIMRSLGSDELRLE